MLINYVHEHWISNKVQCIPHTLMTLLWILCIDYFRSGTDKKSSQATIVAPLNQMFPGII